MKKLIFLIVSVSFLFTILYSRNADAAIMEDYCTVPPYVVQNVPPNIMIVLDNSGSMFNFAYVDPGADLLLDTADDVMCTASGTPCTGFTARGTYPTFKYYGYFDPDYWYTYGSNRFTPTAPKTGSGLSGARAKTSSEWDGNFLNWLTMRRVDIIRKVMTGGLSTGSGLSTRLLGEIADSSGRGIYKSTISADTPNYTEYTGAKTYTFNTAGSGTSSFSVSGGGGTFNVDVIVALTLPLPAQTASQVKVEGVLQRAVGAKARIGLSFYRPNTSASTQGGFVQTSVAGTSLSAVVNQINNTRPNSNTPLAETLWMVTGYFAQDNTMGQGSPEPNYNNNAFTINPTNDPMNYGTGGQQVNRSCGKSFVLYITDGEPCADGYLPATLSDYASGKSNYNCSGSNCPAVAPFSASTFPTCGAGGNVAGIEDVALYAHTTDLRSSTIGVNAIDGTQNLSMYFVFAFGKGSTLLRYAAINGGFEDSNGNNIPDLQSEWDNNSDNEPDTFYEATDGAVLETSIEAAFSTMLKRASSGTAASVLASGEGRGANLLQAVFYPRRAFGNDVIGWTGSLQNLWYYVDPFFANSSIREDTTDDKILNLQNDYIIQFYFDNTVAIPATKARRFVDTDGDGGANSQITPDIKLEEVGNLWEAGKLLWSREVTGATAVPRKIYTTINGTSFLSGDFSTTNASTLASYLQAASTTEAENIIKYTHGEDITLDANNDSVNDFRARTVTIGVETHVWKLGDILDSTPRISAWVQLNNYDKVYSDTTYSDFVVTTGYKNRGMVFAGANDGMLHAFNFGLLEEKWTGQGTYEKARLTGADLGKEMWAFIPKNVLPYLKYITDPDYCHVFNVDLTPFLFDASISGLAGDTRTVNSWRTILIGGMRTGGACRGTTTACTDVDEGGSGSKDCVNTPVDVSGASVGYSSYFAIDITDQNNPILLWEFSEADIPAGDRGLGFATAGPSVVRIGNGASQPSPDSINGSWFVVFGSGPTGPINTLNTQFMGRSDQNLRLYILDLKTGSLVRTINTGIQYAFAGSMINSTMDTDLDYQDDAVYIGYTKRNTADGAGTTANPYKWTQGGVGRLLTKENVDPAQWAWSIVMDDIGTVTSRAAKVESTKTKILWLYFGTGRSYFANADSIDDPTNQRTLFGIKDPCFTSPGVYNLSCTTSVAIGSLTDVTNIASVPSESTANGSGFSGWYINLDASGNYTYAEGQLATPVTKNYGAERAITDTMSTATGGVFFTTYKPYTDVCSIGGKSFLWAVRYNTGGSLALKGKALIQVSTGSVEEKNLADAFTMAGGRKSGSMEGVPPTGAGLALLTTPLPVKRIQHIKER